MKIIIRKYSNEAACFGENFVAGAALYQLQILHEAVPTALFRMVNHFGEFLEEQHAADSAVPKSLREFEQSFNAKLVVSNAEDPLGLGVCQWRVAFYVSGETRHLKNLMLLLDSFFHWRYENEQQKQFPRELELEVNNMTELDIAVSAEEDELQCKVAVHKSSPVEKDTLGSTSVLHAQPPTWKRTGLRADIEVLEADKIGIVFRGDTYPYRSNFDAALIGGQFVKQDGTPADRGEEGAEYFRVIPEFAFGEDADVSKALYYFTGLLHSSVIGITWDKTPDDSTLLAIFKARLEVQPNVIRIAA